MPRPHTFSFHMALVVDPLYSSMCVSVQVEALSNSADAGSLAHREFEEHLLITHYLAVRAACLGVPQLKTLASKLSVSLLRHTNILSADKAFFEAGQSCKVCPSLAKL